MNVHMVLTVAILAQGTHWAVANLQAFFACRRHATEMRTCGGPLSMPASLRSFASAFWKGNLASRKPLSDRFSLVRSRFPTASRLSEAAFRSLLACRKPLLDRFSPVGSRFSIASRLSEAAFRSLLACRKPLSDRFSLVGSRFPIASRLSEAAFWVLSECFLKIQRPKTEDQRTKEPKNRRPKNQRTEEPKNRRTKDQRPRTRTSRAHHYPRVDKGSMTRTSRACP
jgi:hypothetical protein